MIFPNNSFPQKTFSRIALQATALALGVFGAVTAAQAQVYAVSYNNILNLNVTTTDEFDGSGPFFIPLADFNSFNATSSASGLLNGAVDPANPPNALSLGGPTNALLAFGMGSIFPAPGTAPADNAMTPLDQEAGANYAYGDAQVSSTAILQASIGGPIIPTLASTQAWNIAETYIDANGFANAAALNSSETGFDTSFTLMQAAKIVFEFDADPYLYVEMGALAAGGTANANLDLTFTITGGGATVFGWSPNGAPGSITGGTESLDPQSLNRSIEVTTPGDSSLYDPTGDASAGNIAPGTVLSYRAVTDVLPPGQYTLSLDTLGNVNVLTALAPVTFDLGDNPDGSAGTSNGDYSTVASNNGPQHQIAGPYLGFCVDADDGTLHSPGADADDLDTGAAVGTCGNGDDEDGVTLPPVVSPGEDYDALILMPPGASVEDCAVDGWLDFNGNGVFGDAGEYVIAQTVGSASGTTAISFSVPNDAAIGPLYGRFRCSREGALNSTGSVDNGEVEDYVITVVPGGNEVEVPLLGPWGIALLSLLLGGVVSRRRKGLGSH